MSDIVERLKSAWDGTSMYQLRIEAADDIRRLRARVEELQAPIMEVAKVVPGESRIETACWIIREHETGVLVQPRSPTMSDIHRMEGGRQ